MIKRLAKIEQQLQAGEPPRITMIWPGEEPPPARPGEKVIRIQMRWDDSLEIETPCQQASKTAAR